MALKDINININKKNDGTNSSVFQNIPVIIFDQFLTKGGQFNKINELLCKWASTVVDMNLAHVVFISDNSSVLRYLDQCK